MSIDRERRVEDALRETLARYDAAIVLDPSKGYHYGAGPSVEFIAKGVASRLADAYEAAPGDSLDVERLARALCATHDPDPADAGMTSEEIAVDDACRLQARHVAAEYARLATRTPGAPES